MSKAVIYCDFDVCAQKLHCIGYVLNLIPKCNTFESWNFLHYSCKSDRNINNCLKGIYISDLGSQQQFLLIFWVLHLSE